jgi:AraC-like DNA-binding protein
MTVYARPARDLTLPAIREADVRCGSPVRAGTFAYAGEDVVTGWHRHDLHQLEYSFQGTVELETETARYLLPPQQAVWIPAGVTHQTTVRRSVRTVSAFFCPDLVPGAGDRVRILAASPLVREMLLYGVRWPIHRQPGSQAADTFFAALACLVADSLDQETPLRLPTSTDPLIAAVIAYTEDHVQRVSATEVARAVGVSERTLRRKFLADTGISWHGYLRQSRLLRAMTMLAGKEPTVLDVAIAVGFGSLSAFTRAFTSSTGESPTTYRRRVTAPPADSELTALRPQNRAVAAKMTAQITGRPAR